MVSAVGDNTIHVQRRSLETRLSESMAEAAVTPQAFVSQVQTVKSGILTEPQVLAASSG